MCKVQCYIFFISLAVFVLSVFSLGWGLHMAHGMYVVPGAIFGIVSGTVCINSTGGLAYLSGEYK